jgi:hypothetical protein
MSGEVRAFTVVDLRSWVRDPDWTTLFNLKSLHNNVRGVTPFSDIDFCCPLDVSFGGSIYVCLSLLFGTVFSYFRQDLHMSYPFSVCLSICVFISLAFFFSVRMPLCVDLSICLSDGVCVYLSVCQCGWCVCVCMSVILSV